MIAPAPPTSLSFLLAPFPTAFLRDIKRSNLHPWPLKMGQKENVTYNSGDSLVVTHLTTNPPVHCLYKAERTGSLILNVLWSYVE
jgi:hypothetical protein